MITLLLKSPDRDLLLKALQVYKEELAQAEEAIRNPVLRNDFSHQLNVATELETAIHNAVDNTLTDAELINRIAEFKPRNEKINAIKFLREQRHMGLKEAKDYVEQVWANPPKLYVVDIETRSPLPDYDALDRHRDGDFDGRW